MFSRTGFSAVQTKPVSKPTAADVFFFLLCTTLSFPPQLEADRIITCTRIDHHNICPNSKYLLHSFYWAVLILKIPILGRLSQSEMCYVPLQFHKHQIVENDGHDDWFDANKIVRSRNSFAEIRIKGLKNAFLLLFWFLERFPRFPIVGSWRIFEI